MNSSLYLKFIKKKYNIKIKKIKIFSIGFLFLLYFIFIKKNNLSYLIKIQKNNLYNNQSDYKIVAISYANKFYKRQILLNEKTAIEIGKVDKYYSYGPDDIDPIFREKNKDILSRRRGNGYWLWKPYFILKTLKEKLIEGDYLIYTDAAILYLDTTYKIINFLKEQNAEMWAIQLSNCIEKKYTKRDAFILLGADSPFYTNTNMYMAGIQVYRKSKFTEKFLEELLYYSQDKRIITDDPNILGQKNYKEFRENRHDQSVFSLLIKKYGQANSGMTNMNIDSIRKTKIIMPNIFCIYRRTKFKNYIDIKNKCIKNIKKRK